jgi:phosphoglycerate dehydrogenase-like enzyme
MKNALIIADRYDEAYSPEMQERLASLVNVVAPPQGSDICARSPELLRDVDIILSTWGPPKLDAEFLAATPRLEAFFYAAGSMRHVLTPAAVERDIVICSGIYLNSVPVAEYTLAQIILSLKHTYQATNAYREDLSKSYSTREIPGTSRGKVGLIALGNIGRILADMLRPLGVEILVFDPGLCAEDIRNAGAQPATLEELFKACDVISLHAPEVAATKGMVSGRLLQSMKPGASFINTSRGSLVREDELAEVLRERRDLFAILDVTAPEPPHPSSPLWHLRNVLLTPHISGSQGAERRRLGQAMMDELARFLDGKPLKWRLRCPEELTEVTHA